MNANDSYGGDVGNKLSAALVLRVRLNTATANPSFTIFIHTARMSYLTNAPLPEHFELQHKDSHLLSNSPLEMQDVSRDVPSFDASRRLVKSWSRPVRNEDSEQIISLIGSIWKEFPGKSLNVQRDMPELIAPESSAETSGGMFWVLEKAHEIVATVALIPSQQGGRAELQKLYVRPQERRLKLGSALCGLVESEAARRSYSAVELWSDLRLVAAHRLYNILGFIASDHVRQCKNDPTTFRRHFIKHIDAAERAKALKV